MFIGGSAEGLLGTVNEQRQGIIVVMVSCLLLCFSLYCAFQVNRCVRPYMAGTHVRSKKEKFWHIRGVLSVCGMVYLAQIDLKVGDSFEKELSNGPEHHGPEHREHRM